MRCPVIRTEPRTVRCTPQGNIELMSKKKVLDFKPAPRLEQIDDKRPKQMEDRKHRSRGCPDSPSSRESARMGFSGTTRVSAPWMMLAHAAIATGRSALDEMHHAAPPCQIAGFAANRPPSTLQPNLASGLSRERVEGRLALALCRLVSRHMGLRLVLVRLWFLFFLISFLSLRHGGPPVCSI